MALGADISARRLRHTAWARDGGSSILKLGSNRGRDVTCLCLLALGQALPGAIQTAEIPHHRPGEPPPFLNESFIAGLRSSLDIDDTTAMPANLLRRQPPKVRVYPSEHYYCFGLTASGRSRRP
jgi:hypothetical protein